MSELEKAVQTIENILGRHGIQPRRFILFGSRARGDAQPDSDWDIFVVVDQDLSVPEQHRLVTEIKRALARLRVPNDVVLKSEERFQALQAFPGSLCYDVAQEGIAL
jgi:predicted nucleotidyltransferase